MSKLYVDSFIVKLAVRNNGEVAVKAALQKAMDDGHTLVCTEASSIDNLIFRKNVDWFRKYLANGKIIIEIYQGNPGDTASGIHAMVNKKFEWSSYDGQITNWTGNFEDLARTMSDYQNLIKLYKTVLKYALPKGAWAMGPWKTANFFTEEQLAELKLEKTQAGNRTLVFEKMRENGYPKEMYVEYIKEYLAGLTSQHHCEDIILLEMI